MSIKIEGHRELKDNIRREMNLLQKTAADLGIEGAAAKLVEIDKALASDRFRLLVAGRFKNGKSTLLNALLGDLPESVAEVEGGQGPMPVNYIPCTAILTLVTYAEVPYVRVWRTDGSSEDWSLRRYLAEATVKDDEEATRKFFETIRMFEVGYPAELCKEGVDVIDSPGTSDTPQRTQYTRQAAETADAAIAVFRSQPFAGQDELEFLESAVVRANTRAFYVINLWDELQLDERIKAYFWNHLVNFWQGGPRYSGQPFATQNIFLVNALKAERGKLAHDSALVEQSGLAELERHLSDFLKNERHLTHIVKFSTAADQQAAAMLENMVLQLNALATDTEVVQKAYERSIQARQEIQKKRQRILQIMEKHHLDAERCLRISFDSVFNGIESGLASALEDYKLPSGGGVLSMFRRKKMADEASEFCKSYIERAFDQWSDPSGGAQQDLTEVLDSMFAEVAGEIDKIERQYREIHVELTGKVAPGLIQNEPAMADRILSTALGFAVGDPSAILTGYTDGWKGLALTITTQLTVILGGLALGVSAPILVPAAIVTAIVARGALAHFTGENDAKKRVLQVVLNGDPGAKPPAPALRDLRPKIYAAIHENLLSQFRQIQGSVMSNVDAAIREEERAIETVRADSRRSLEEKAALGKKIEAGRATTDGVRGRMNELLARAKQM
jgi:hypothetical protein